MIRIEINRFIRTIAFLSKQKSTLISTKEESRIEKKKKRKSEILIQTDEYGCPSVNLLPNEN